VTWGQLPVFSKKPNTLPSPSPCGDAKAQALAAVAQATVGSDWKRAKRLDGAEHAARSVRRDRIPLPKSEHLNARTNMNVMLRDKLTVIWRMTHPLAAEDRAAWDSLIPAFTEELPHPERVELVITDQYRAVAGEYAVQSPTRANPGMTAADYQAVKVDGAMAAAKTNELPGGKATVVVNASLVRLGHERASRSLLHEAQHVRLLQDEDGAWGVHRRVAFTLPDDLSFDFIWLAETAIDEFRCERALYEAGVSPLNMGSDPADYSGIIASFEPVRYGFRRTADVLAAYQGAMSVLDRLGQFLAYGAAYIAIEQTQAAKWVSIPSMAQLVGIVSDLASAHQKVSDERLAAHCIELARMLRRTLRDNGFDSYLQPDGGLYFDVLW
jgi:hypothetical protein